MSAPVSEAARATADWRSTRRRSSRTSRRARPRRRAGPAAPGGWRVRPEVKSAILARFARPDDPRLDGRAVLVPGPCVDSAARAERRSVADRARAARASGPGPPRRRRRRDAAVVREHRGVDRRRGTMVDSHVLVGSCAQIGSDVHLAAGVLVGGVLEPPGARPVIVEDGAFVGAGSALLDGVLVGRRRRHRRGRDA